MIKSSTPKAAARKARPTQRKKAPKIADGKARDTRQHTSKVVAEKARAQRKSAFKVTVGDLGDTQRRIAAQFEEFHDNQAPDTLQALAERNVAQTREVYERKNVSKPY